MKGNWTTITAFGMRVIGTLVLMMSLTWASHAQGQDCIVKLHKVSCSPDTAASRNAQVLQRNVKSHTVVVIPDGRFNVGRVLVDGVCGLVVGGTTDEETGESLSVLRFSSDGGIVIQNGVDVSIRDLRTEGQPNSDLVILKNTEDFHMTNYSSAEATSEVCDSCLEDFSWLVPVLSIVLD